MNIKSNKRKLTKTDDELAPLWEDLRISIMRRVRENVTKRRGSTEIPLPKIYKIVSRGDERWAR